MIVNPEKLPRDKTECEELIKYLKEYISQISADFNNDESKS